MVYIIRTLIEYLLNLVFFICYNHKTYVNKNVNKNRETYNLENPSDIPIVYRCYKCNDPCYYMINEGTFENDYFVCNKHK